MCNPRSYFLLSLSLLLGCIQPSPGPDKQFAGELSGAVLGAGAGAVTGAQVSAATGPGIVVGAGFGAVAGGIQGLVQDQNEEDLLKIAAQTREERSRVYAQELLAEHYKRRVELHPNRDIFPADMFFNGDSVKLCSTGKYVVKELATLNKYRKPYSRLVIAVYSKAADPNSEYALFLAERRSRAIVEQFTRYGLEPRRLKTRSVVVDAPVLIDPEDRSDRYNQAVEIIPIDR